MSSLISCRSISTVNRTFDYRGESVLTLSLVVRKVSLIAISPNVRSLLTKVLEIFEAIQQTGYGIFLCANL